MKNQLEGARVLITAGASGIGLAIVRALLREGARIHTCDNDVAALDHLARDEPGVTRSNCDVADRGQVKRMFDDAQTALGGLDVLVNNAGIAGPTGPCEEITPEDWERTLAVNITGQFNCARLAIPQLREGRNASIVNLSSAAGRFGFPNRSPYAASKWAVIGFTQSLAIELGRDGIRVNAICPGSVAGPRIDHVFERKAALRGVDPAVVREEAMSKTSMHSLVEAEDIANAVVFLCSPAGARITGHALPVDAGTQSLV